jgi:hypothetical protein
MKVSSAFAPIDVRLEFVNFVIVDLAQLAVTRGHFDHRSLDFDDVAFVYISIVCGDGVALWLQRRATFDCKIPRSAGNHETSALISRRCD